MNFASDKLTASLCFLKDAKEAGADKINGFVNDILGMAPLIEVTGFNMKDVSVDVGIPLGMSISFVKEKDVDAETINQLLEDNKDKEMLKLIVRPILTTSRQRPARRRKISKGKCKKRNC